MDIFPVFHRYVNNYVNVSAYLKYLSQVQALENSFVMQTKCGNHKCKAEFSDSDNTFNYGENHALSIKTLGMSTYKYVGAVYLMNILKQMPVMKVWMDFEQTRYQLGYGKTVMLWPLTITCPIAMTPFITTLPIY